MAVIPLLSPPECSGRSILRTARSSAFRWVRARLRKAYFAADRLSVADLKVFVWIRHLKSGALDHVPADLPDRVAPKLVEHYERVKNDPRVKAYYAKHGLSG
jgi:glutathione S-transferase